MGAIESSLILNLVYGLIICFDTLWVRLKDIFISDNGADGYSFDTLWVRLKGHLTEEEKEAVLRSFDTLWVRLKGLNKAVEYYFQRECFDTPWVRLKDVNSN